MSNFYFLRYNSKYKVFADAAIATERAYSIDPATCAVCCRRAMEFAVKWMYSVDSALKTPYQDRLVSLLNTDEFKKLFDEDLLRRLNYIRLVGNNANHNPKSVTTDQAMMALKNLFVFMDFIDYSYSEFYTPHIFDESLLAALTPQEPAPVIKEEIDLNLLMQENAPERQTCTKRRESRTEPFHTSPLDMTEAHTRKVYIDVLLTNAGWTRGINWIDEFPIERMPNTSGIGFADYVLLDDDGRPLAVVEAKRTSVDIAKGRQQAKLYADDLERRFGRRPIIFLTNGVITRIVIDQKNGYPERQVSGIYSKRDLQKEFNKMTMRTPLTGVLVNDEITNRYYQKEAVKAVCEACGQRNKRKALIVMATGSGKTRTVMSIVDVLVRHGWVKNFLFLADRNSLVTQAKRAFHNYLPDLSITNLCEEWDNLFARGVFSTYQTMMGQIDEATAEDGKRVFTPGHFDLIIIDEAHRSIYKKYRDIFGYFDAVLVGLTATPREEIDHNTYELFELEAGVPTFGYELEQAVRDGFLVDFRSIETQLKFMMEGITYDDLSETEKEEYEDLFATEENEIPDSIESSALNEWIFNKDTIRQALNILMTKGLRVEYGSKIGKTIIFAKSHLHAEKILEVWNREYPNYPSGFCRVIDNYTNYSQSLIDEFSEKHKMPQIAISVDMLDTGIDIPEILNLVFFKKVLSKTKFWQMIGRGTRLCAGLIDGEDKKEFFIFDFCSNFEFFRVNNGKGVDARLAESVQEQLFNIKTELTYRLQGIDFQVEALSEFRKELVSYLRNQVIALNRDNFAVRQHIVYVDLFSDEETYKSLNFEDTLNIREHIAPLIDPLLDEYTAVRFDVLLHGIELAFVMGKSYMRARGDLIRKVRALSKYGTIPEVFSQKDYLRTLLETDYLERAGLKEFEEIRIRLRVLMKYVEYDPTVRYDTNFSDTILEINENKADFGPSDLENYKLKVNYYIRMHEDNPVILKLKTNLPLSKQDVVELEKILWSEVGSKKDYEKEYGEIPLGELVRSIVGLDMQAAKEAFSCFLNRNDLDSRQIYFINQIINYIVHNGLLKDFSILQRSPFAERGSVAEIFKDHVLWLDIRNTIERVNRNAEVA